MKNFTIIKLSTCWSTDTLHADVEQLINQKSREGYVITTVSFGVNMWWMPTAFITICKQVTVRLFIFTVGHIS